MARPFDRDDFRKTYDRWIVKGSFNEEPWYYPRYRSRYEAIIELFAKLASPDPLRVLDIGGGQHALLAMKLWNDRATVADVTEDHLDYVRQQGVETVRWDLSRQEPPFTEPFDAIIFSEVIEHLPCAGYIALERLRRCLRPGGILICTTPNFYRPRNLVYLATGRPIFDHFRRPEAGGGGHLIEYDIPRLQWQFDEAGFKDVSIERRQFRHNPTMPIFRVMYWLASHFLDTPVPRLLSRRRVRLSDFGVIASEQQRTGLAFVDSFLRPERHSERALECRETRVRQGWLLSISLVTLDRDLSAGSTGSKSRVLRFRVRRERIRLNAADRKLSQDFWKKSRK